MNKNMQAIGKWIFAASMLLLAAPLLTSCDDEYEYPSNNDPIVVNSIHLSNAKDTISDRTISYARLGQLIRIDGTGFLGIRKIYINGVSAYFNTTLMSNTSMIVSVPTDAPIADAAASVRNTIRFVKSGSNELEYDFEIRPAVPTVSSISHTLPQAGEKIYLYGTSLFKIHRITFPGNIQVTNNIESDSIDGKYCSVIVPNGITASGAVLVEGSAGAAYSPSYFNFTQGLYLTDFSADAHHGWGKGEYPPGGSLIGISADLNAAVPTTGDEPKSQGIYRAFNPTAAAIPISSFDYSFYWANSSYWSSVFTESVIPAATSTSLCAVQMDIYVDGEWNSGSIRMVVADGAGTSRYCMTYTPWVENGKAVTFKNPEGWFTVTFPFSNSADYEGKTFQEVTTSVTTAAYKQWGPHFDNTDVLASDKKTVIQAATPTSVKIYFDNLRVVPLDVPEYIEYDSN